MKEQYKKFMYNKIYQKIVKHDERWEEKDAEKL